MGIPLEDPPPGTGSGEGDFSNAPELATVLSFVVEGVSSVEYESVKNLCPSRGSLDLGLESLDLGLESLTLGGGISTKSFPEALFVFCGLES